MQNWSEFLRWKMRIEWNSKQAADHFRPVPWRGSLTLLLLQVAVGAVVPHSDASKTRRSFSQAPGSVGSSPLTATSFSGDCFPLRKLPYAAQVNPGGSLYPVTPVWDNSERPAQLQSSQWDWLRPALRLHCSWSSPSAQFCLLHSLRKGALESKPLPASLHLRVFPGEPDLRQASSRNIR